MTALVTGMGWLTSSGLGQGRLRGKDAFALTPGALPEVRRQELFDEHPRFGRMDGYCRAGLAGVVMALRDAGLQGPLGLGAGLAASTRHGCLQTDLDYFATAMQGHALASPNLFAFTLPTSFLAEAAICFGLRGPTHVLHEPETFGLAGVRAALEAIEFGEAEIMLAGACEIAPTDWPGNAGRSSHDVPSGSVFLVLENQARAAARPAYGRLELDGVAIRLDGMRQVSLEALVSKMLHASTSCATGANQ